MISEHCLSLFRDTCPVTTAKPFAADQKEDRKVHTLVATFGVEIASIPVVKFQYLSRKRGTISANKEKYSISPSMDLDYKFRSDGT
jgi:hypothetical protein